MQFTETVSFGSEIGLRDQSSKIPARYTYYVHKDSSREDLPLQVVANCCRIGIRNEVGGLRSVSGDIY